MEDKPVTGTIAHYREAGWLESRTFDLTSDVVVVKGWGFAGWRPTGESRLRLSELDPEVSGRTWAARADQHTALFGAVVAACFVGLAVLLFTSTGGKSQWWLALLSSMLGALVLTAAFATLDPRRVEYIHFNHRTGGLYALSVGKLGPQAHEFDVFVGLLVKAIRAQQRGT